CARRAPGGPSYYFDYW
nr:immunoglobulin heavy chain junction region [Mus musculus]